MGVNIIFPVGRKNSAPADLCSDNCDTAKCKINSANTCVVCKCTSKNGLWCTNSALFYYFALFILSLSLLASSTMAQLSSDYPVSIDTFTGHFYKETVNQPDHKGKNVIMSALSADVVVSMVALAAQDETKKEIVEVLCMQDIDKMTPSIKETLQVLNNAKGITLRLANKVYIKPSSSGKLDSVLPLYRTSVEDIFKSEIQQINFGDNVRAASTINQWVEDKTNNRIKELIKPDALNSMTAAVLVNAIYFKGSWAKKFKAENTKPEDFTLADDSKVKVDMMNMKSKFLYCESKELESKIIILPYEGREVSMVVILPNKVDGLSELESKLADGVKRHLDNAQLFEVEVVLKLPKFKIETTIDVKKVLGKLGINRLFDESLSQLRGILNEDTDLYVSDAVQKAFIEVNEEGAEAAAATGVIMGLFGSSPMPKPMVMRFIADHPFYYQISSSYVRVFQTHQLPLFNGCYSG